MSILLKSGTIVTMDSEERIIEDGAIYVENDKIVDIGKTREVAKKHKAEKIIDAKKKLVIPGLINAHVHLALDLMRGLGTDMVLLDWLQNYVWPGFAAITKDDAYVGALLGCIENIKTGSTCVVDNYYGTRERHEKNMDRIAEAVEKIGIRAILVGGYHDKEFIIPKPFIVYIDEVIKEYSRFISKWHNKAGGKIKVWTSPVNLLFCTPESIVELHQLAQKHKIGIHTHVAESRREVELIKKEYGKGYVEVFCDLGVLGPKFHAVHSVWLSDKEIQLLSQTNSRVIYNPTSNMLLASGVAPIPKMLRAGITVGLGTDASNCSNNLDMVATLRFATLLQKVHYLDPIVISAKGALRMATIEGAKALGLEKEIGSLEVGKKADITIIDLLKPHIIPVHDPIANLVYSANGNDVDTVIVDGKILMENKVIIGINEREVLEKAQEMATDLAARAGIVPKSP